MTKFKPDEKQEPTQGEVVSGAVQGDIVEGKAVPMAVVLPENSVLIDADAVDYLVELGYSRRPAQMMIDCGLEVWMGMTKETIERDF